MVNRIVVFIVLIFISYASIIAQHEDNIWLLGSSSINTTINGFQFGNTVIDFSEVEPYIYYDSLITLDFDGTNASICSPQGELLLYSNGMHVHDNSHENILNGDTIAHSGYWENWVLKDYLPDGSDWVHGFPIIQGAQILPLDSSYIILYNIRDFGEVQNLSYSKIKQNSNGLFFVEEKDVPILEDNLNIGQINACRHANGRDWWLIQQNIESDSAFVFYISEEKIELSQTLVKEKRIPVGITLPQVYFNPTGTMYATAEGQGTVDDLIMIVTLYDFDRCHGLLNEISKDTFPGPGLRGAMAFSPSGQYLYASSHDEIYQYDVWEEDWKSTRNIVTEYDGFFFQYPGGSIEFPTKLGVMALGPDGRIYSVPSGNNRYLNVIEFPDEHGEESNMIQHKIMLPTDNFLSVPNFPNYRLGPLDGSGCDTLGMDSNPVSLFRFAQDTSDYLNVRFTDLSYYRPETWEWDFGDGFFYSGKKPYFHRYEEDGAYHVCLTVSNENSENKYCKTIFLGVTGVENDLDKKQVYLFPNPVEQKLYIELKEYLAKDASILIYDQVGTLKKRFPIRGGWNNFDVESLSTGLYIYSIIDDFKVIFNGKFVKM